MRRAALALALALTATGCAEAPPMAAAPPPPPPRDPVRSEAARVEAARVFEAVCLRRDLALSGAEAALAAAGYAAAPPAGAFARFTKADVTVELRRGEQRPVQASNCLVTSPLLTAEEARVVGALALVQSGAPFEPGSSGGATIGAVRAADHLGLARLVVDPEPGVALLKTPAPRGG